ncbi:hypothetical protein MPK66_gp037 [Erwinia phage pEa_SNUABM_2]|uniref:Uncharacterized protein n=1 Tax=Erwinia phage pEa_SNUABM_2 TaxID=2869547 RepID=A0AAE7XPR9_9CAUD|nr:hypothetical protein MPK66_gp037 [Erwinia phage pEa_SNUABM_2]QZE59281.1 hypothetical protein pEaSNUABM2_00037 [Erwinia phage pEa_SNUABM_2]QZE59617.1 hypothetical protein pEaSNUABM39_00037 [Erwinia phage pEa_SNUABM_39]
MSIAEKVDSVNSQRESERKAKEETFIAACQAIIPKVSADMDDLLRQFIHENVNSDRIVLGTPKYSICDYKFKLTITVDFHENRDTQFTVELAPDGPFTLIKDRERQRAWFLRDITFMPYENALSEMLYHAVEKSFSGKEWRDRYGPNLGSNDVIFSHLYLRS